MKKYDIINLIPYFQPFGPATVSHAGFNFNGGEVHFKLLNPIDRKADHCIITSKIRCSDDVVRILLGVDAAKRSGARKLSLFIPYLPYARQDRVCEPGESLSIAVIARLINSLELENVFIFDPHSDVAGSLIERVVIIDQLDYLRHNFHLHRAEQRDRIVLVAPDAGALKKVYKLAQALEVQCISANKNRNTATGEITSITLSSPISEEIRKKRFVVVDDICDGGRTFIELAKILRAEDIAPENLTLAVSHGIFSQGLDPLLQHFTSVYYTDSWTDLRGSGCVQLSSFLNYAQLTEYL